MTTDNIDIESLLADILDDTKPLPGVSSPLVQAIQPIPPAALQPSSPENVLASLMGEEAPTVESALISAEIGAAELMGELEPPLPAATQGQSIFTDTVERQEEEEKLHIKLPTFTSADLADTMDLRNYANLVTLNMSRWHAKVKDRKASKDAAIASNADEHAFETRKRLLVGADDLLKAIHRSMDEARIKHYELTLPWSTTGMDDAGRRSGSRLLPNSLFFDYTTEMARCKQAMQAALSKFVPEYPALIETARQKLGTRFDPSEYPGPDTIEKHFSLGFDFHPVPTGMDFKGLPQQQLDALARHLNKSTQTMMENAMAEVWVRLRDAVSRMAERLSSPDKLFHYTLVENVRDVVRLVKHLNLTNDARVEKIRRAVEKHLCAHDVKELKSNANIRSRVGAHATSILQEMDK